MLSLLIKIMIKINDDQPVPAVDIILKKKAKKLKQHK